MQHSTPISSVSSTPVKPKPEGFLQRESGKAIIRIAIIVSAFVLTIGGAAAIGLTGMGFWIVGAVIALASAIMISNRPEQGIYILVIFIYANLSVILENAFGIPDSNKFLVALIFVGILAKRVVLEHKPLIFRFTELTIIFVGISITISLFLSDYKWDAQEIILDWFKDFLILLILVQVSTSDRVYKNAIWALIFTATFISILSTYQSLTGDYANEFYGLAKAPIQEITVGNDAERITGPLDDPNFYGMILLAVLPAAFYRVLAGETTSVRLIGGFCSFFILLTIFFTFSRGALIALLLIAILIIRERKMNPYKVAAGAVIMGVLVSPFLPHSFWDRAETITAVFDSAGNARNQSEVSFRGRTSEMIVAVMMFQDHPLTGVGRHNYLHNYQSYSGRLGLDRRIEARQAHSLYLELAAEQGVVGLITFALMLYFVYMASFKARREARALGRHDLVAWFASIQIGLTAYLVSSILLHGDYARYMWLMIGFTVASSVVTHELTQQREERDRLDHQLLSTEPSLAYSLSER